MDRRRVVVAGGGSARNCYQSKRCNSGNLAARPGYSNHQNGLALDLSTSTWLARNASKYGFVRTVPKEAWHTLLP